MEEVAPDAAADENTAHLNALLDESDVRRIHWRIWILSAMGVFLDGFDFFVIAVALPLLDELYKPAPWELGLLASSALVGAIVGALTIGRLTDLLGRRAVYVVDLGLFMVFTALTAISWDVWPLIVFRFGVGIAVGADYPISAAFVSEVMPKRVRGRFLVGAFSFQAVGAVMGALTSWLILLIWPDIQAWRIMFIVGVIPAAAIALARRGVPESPRWLLEQGETEKAAAIVSLIVGKQVSVKKTRKLVKQPVIAAKLFTRKHRRKTILSAVPWFLQDISTYGIGLFTPIILGAAGIAGAKAGAGGGHANFINEAIAKAQDTVLVDLALIVGFVVAIIFIERLGRMRMQIGGFIMMAVGLITLAISTYLTRGGAANLTLVFVGFIVFNFFMNFGPNSTTYVLPVELFPTKLRATAHGFAAAVAKAGAVLGAWVFPIIDGRFGIAPTLYIVAGAALLAAIVTLAYRIEPKRALET